MEYQSLLENRIINRDNPYPLFLFHQLKNNRNDRRKYRTFQENCTCEKDWNYRKSEAGRVIQSIGNNHTKNRQGDRTENKRYKGVDTN